MIIVPKARDYLTLGKKHKIVLENSDGEQKQHETTDKHTRASSSCDCACACACSSCGDNLCQNLELQVRKTVLIAKH